MDAMHHIFVLTHTPLAVSSLVHETADYRELGTLKAGLQMWVLTHIYMPVTTHTAISVLNAYV